MCCQAWWSRWVPCMQKFYLPIHPKLITLFLLGAGELNHSQASVCALLLRCSFWLCPPQFGIYILVKVFTIKLWKLGQDRVGKSCKVVSRPWKLFRKYTEEGVCQFQKIDLGVSSRSVSCIECTRLDTYVTWCRVLHKAAHSLIHLNDLLMHQNTTNNGRCTIS